jgi:3-isopropylmalate dehydrogenase
VKGADVMILRELTGGIYFGEPRGIREEEGQRFGLNTMIYTEAEVKRVVRRGFELARERKGKLMSVDKANAMEVGRFWRDMAGEVAGDYPDVAFDSMYVDNAAMQIIRDPLQFDTIVTGNMFGDILSDAAGNLAGSLGMLPSASLGEFHALYEPCHGSAPDISGKDIANPVASILSVGMMFRHSFGKAEADEAIHGAVEHVLATHRTADTMAAGKTQVGCSQMGDLIAEYLENNA